MPCPFKTCGRAPFNFFFMQQLLVLICVVIVWLASCKPDASQNGVLARVGGNVLLAEDIKFIEASGNAGDSLEYVKLYVDRWIKKQLMLQKAELNLSDDQKNIEKMVSDYRASLLIYKYQQEMLHQKMDTAVKNNEMMKYYEMYKSDFILDSAIVKARVVKAPLGFNQLNGLRKMIKHDDLEQIAQLENLCFQNKIFYHLTSEWLTLSSLNSIYPGKGDFFRYAPYHEKTDSAFVYLLYVSSFKLANDTVPFEFTTEKIKELILRKRKVKFIKDLENSIYNDGISNNLFTTYIQ